MSNSWTCGTNQTHLGCSSPTQRAERFLGRQNVGLRDSWRGRIAAHSVLLPSIVSRVQMFSSLLWSASLLPSAWRAQMHTAGGLSDSSMKALKEKRWPLWLLWWQTLVWKLQRASVLFFNGYESEMEIRPWGFRSLSLWTHHFLPFLHFELIFASVTGHVSIYNWSETLFLPVKAFQIILSVSTVAIIYI